MPIVTPYNGAEDLASMQAALAAWIDSAGDCGYCHVGDLPHRIYNGFRGRYPLGQMIRIWHESDEIVAFAIVQPKFDGYDAFISPAHRGSGIEREMLLWAFSTTRQWLHRENSDSYSVITDAFACDEVRAKLLREVGYVPDDAPWMYLNERGLDGDLPEVVLPEGYSIRGVRDESDAAQLSAVHSGAFSSNWTPDIYRDEVMRKPGYTPELERVVVAPDGRFAAFCVTWLDKRNAVGLFEPVGTHKDFQRLGLGKALLADTLRFMRERGMRRAQVGAQTDNPASTALYVSVGFTRKHALTEYHRKLPRKDLS